MANGIKNSFLLAVIVAGSTACSAMASQVKPDSTTVASISGVPTCVADPMLNKAINFIHESQTTSDVKVRNQNRHLQKQVVNSHKDLDGVMILGGSDSILM